MERSGSAPRTAHCADSATQPLGGWTRQMDAGPDVMCYSDGALLRMLTAVAVLCAINTTVMFHNNRHSFTAGNLREVPSGERLRDMPQGPFGLLSQNHRRPVPSPRRAKEPTYLGVEPRAPARIRSSFPPQNVSTERRARPEKNICTHGEEERRKGIEATYVKEADKLEFLGTFCLGKQMDKERHSICASALRVPLNNGRTKWAIKPSNQLLLATMCNPVCLSSRFSICLTGSDWGVLTDPFTGTLSTRQQVVHKPHNQSRVAVKLFKHLIIPHGCVTMPPHSLALSLRAIFQYSKDPSI
ncbi:hypothetical protein EYF80_006476 [Liparis tanakae]|uniref:Uncharacterized protein n=1 Tax=Liparis tanakae TaxID=230148 RepID=A0A4Z2IZM7_9TELE|nr:hypothetical protein EYF80_006476 [Liparis tanakae]